MSETRLFVTDLDGTLLDGEKRISADNLAAIERFTEQGGLFTVATGRTEDTCRLATDLMPIRIPVILYNGAAVYDLETGEVLYRRVLKAAAFRPLLREIMARFPDVCIELFAFGPLMLVNPSAVMDPYILREKQPYCELSLDETPDEWLKIMLSAPHERLVAVQAFIETRRNELPTCAMFFSADYYFEILDAGCSKGECVRFLADTLNIRQEDTAAIGDHLNDIDMLRWCGQGFAPANAHPEAKAAADLVLAADNNGSAVAEAIRRILA